MHPSSGGGQAKGETQGEACATKQEVDDKVTALETVAQETWGCTIIHSLFFLPLCVGQS